MNWVKANGERVTKTKVGDATDPKLEEIRQIFSTY